jgi:hypothetical protein
MAILLLMQKAKELLRDGWRQLAQSRRFAAERYLDKAVDFADLEYRMRLVEEAERRRAW